MRSSRGDRVKPQPRRRTVYIDDEIDKLIRPFMSHAVLADYRLSYSGAVNQLLAIGIAADEYFRSNRGAAVQDAMHDVFRRAAGMMPDRDPEELVFSDWPSWIEDTCLRAALLCVLKEDFGGEAPRFHVIEHIELRLRGRLSTADLATVSDGTERWKKRVDAEVQRCRHESAPRLMVPAPKPADGVWKLTAVGMIEAAKAAEQLRDCFNGDI